MTTAKKKQHVARVTQLDAASLDKEINSILKAEIEEIFKSTSPSLLTRFEPEIDALLGLLIWKLSIYDNGATFGQSLMDLKFSDGSKRKRFILATFIVGGKYTLARFRNIFDLAGNAEDNFMAQKILGWTDTALRIANLANKLVFLYEGHFPSLSERILNTHPVPVSNKHNRHIGYSYMTRELLWHSLIELLVFVLPLVNYRAMYSKCTSIFKPKPETGVVKLPDLTLHTTCAVCNQKPILPHHIGCSHIFCSYCLKGNLAANVSFVCPLCSALAEGNVEPVII